MICDKCLKEFPENEIQVSQDIPKYMGGKDEDGRHMLCVKCHNKYEFEVLKIGLMNFIKQLPEVDKVIFRNSAKLVRNYFFKNKRGVKDDSTK